MEIEVRRNEIKGQAVIGDFVVNGKVRASTVEDLPRSSKLKGKTCIPTGTYRVIISLSSRFKRLLPEVLNVPGFAGIRIHTGNTSEDTEGCIIVGRYDGGDSVIDSRLTFAPIFSEMVVARQGGEQINLTITQPKGWPDCKPSLLVRLANKLSR